jgi:DNA-binding NarL/FixJ family response regulator
MQVLLVEDSPILRESIKEMLSGYESVFVEEFAETEQEAIALLDKKQYDLMIVDIELAHGNGFEVVKHTRKPTYSLVPPKTIMLTNHGNLYYKKLAKQCGVEYFFDKSMQFEEAIHTIEIESRRF